jgi:hypothetical protein
LTGDPHPNADRVGGQARWNSDLHVAHEAPQGKVYLEFETRSRSEKLQLASLSAITSSTSILLLNGKDVSLWTTINCAASWKDSLDEEHFRGAVEYAIGKGFSVREKYSPT